MSVTPVTEESLNMDESMSVEVEWNTLPQVLSILVGLIIALEGVFQNDTIYRSLHGCDDGRLRQWLNFRPLILFFMN
jgi:hypothetical protein